MQSNITTLVIHYEDVQENILREMRRILDFLNISNMRTHCILADPNGKFKRSKRDKLHIEFNPFTPDMQRSIDKLITNTNSLLKSHGFPLIHRNVTMSLIF